MSERPFVRLKVAMTLDGFIDDTSDKRLLLSNDEDKAEVVKLRAKADAVIIGAETLRKDNPKIDVHGYRVVLTKSGNLPTAARFFKQEYKGRTLVFCLKHVHEQVEEMVGAYALVLSLENESTALKEVLAKLVELECSDVLVEGGAKIHAQFLEQEMYDELRVAIAPRLVGEGVSFCGLSYDKLQVKEVLSYGNMVVVTYRGRSN